jgi:hypothetical protein
MLFQQDLPLKIPQNPSLRSMNMSPILTLSLYGLEKQKTHPLKFFPYSFISIKEFLKLLSFVGRHPARYYFRTGKRTDTQIEMFVVAD